MPEVPYFLIEVSDQRLPERLSEPIPKSAKNYGLGHWITTDGTYNSLEGPRTYLSEENRIEQRLCEQYINANLSEEEWDKICRDATKMKSPADANRRSAEKARRKYWEAKHENQKTLPGAGDAGGCEIRANEGTDTPRNVPGHDSAATRHSGTVDRPDQAGAGRAQERTEAARENTPAPLRRSEKVAWPGKLCWILR
jgi:hypothetical protein